MGGAWRAVRVTVRVWLRDASLVVDARVLCSTSWATCTDPQIDLERGRLARDGRASTMQLGSVAAVRGSWAYDMRTSKILAALELSQHTGGHDGAASRLGWLRARSLTVMSPGRRPRQAQTHRDYHARCPDLRHARHPWRFLS